MPGAFRSLLAVLLPVLSFSARFPDGEFDDSPHVIKLSPPHRSCPRFVAAFVAAMSTLIHLTLARPTQNQHCQTSTGWNVVKVDGKTMAEAAAAWYFDGSEEKHVDAPFPGNPTCGQSHGRRVLCWLF